MKWPQLTTPPPSRPPESKHPLFTKKFFVTKSFGPGHIVGAGILVLGIGGLARYFIKRGQSEAEATRGQLAKQASPGPSEPKVAQAKNARGQYGKKP
jgi:hypothetical protein